MHQHYINRKLSLDVQQAQLKELELENSHRTLKKTRTSALSTLHSLYIAIQKKVALKIFRYYSILLLHIITILTCLLSVYLNLT